MSTLFDDMTRWASELTWDEVPPATQRRARWAFLDTLGTMVGGVDTPAARVATAYACRWEGTGSALSVTLGRSTQPSHAALVNAVCASALDFDDGHYQGGAIHPGSIVVSAVTACATDETTLEEALTAVVVGYEVGLRAARLLFPRTPTDRYHATGSAGAIGAAAAVARLLRLDADGMARSITIAWSHAPMASFGTPMVKESIGWGALAGVSAAELAESGFMKLPEGAVVTSRPRPATPFHEPGADEDSFVTSFGTVFEIAEAYVKPFASCRYTHAALGGFAELVDAHRIKLADIEKVVVSTHSRSAFLTDATPATIDAAQYSFPFVLASFALHGQLGAPEMSEARLRDRAVLELAARIQVESDPSLDHHYPAHYPSRVEIVTPTVTATGTYVASPGDPGFAEEMLDAKVRRLLTVTVDEAVAQDIIHAVLTPSAETVLLDVLAPWA